MSHGFSSFTHFVSTLARTKRLTVTHVQSSGRAAYESAELTLFTDELQRMARLYVPGVRTFNERVELPASVVTLPSGAERIAGHPVAVLLVLGAVAHCMPLLTRADFTEFLHHTQHRTQKMSSKAELLASLHAVALEKFQELLGAPRRAEVSVNVDNLPSAIAGLYQLDNLQEYINDVFRTAFLDTYSIMLTAQVVGANQACNLAHDLLALRAEETVDAEGPDGEPLNGGIGALTEVLEALEAGKDFRDVSPSALRDLAVGLAARGTGEWVAQGGAPDIADRYGEFLETLAANMVVLNTGGQLVMEADADDAPAVEATVYAKAEVPHVQTFRPAR